MRKIIYLIGLILSLGIFLAFSQAPSKTTDDQMKSPSEENHDTPRDAYTSQVIITIPWGEGEDQIRRHTMPRSFAISPDGQFAYVPDFYKRRILVFNSKGELVWKINSMLSSDDRMGATISDIVVDGKNNIYFMGYPTLTTTHIRKIDLSGKKIFEVNVPHDIGGNIWIVEDTLFYGNVKESMLVYDINRNKQLEQSFFDGVKTNSYFVDFENNVIQNKERSKILVNNINLKNNIRPTKVLGEDNYGNLYLQYGDYEINITNCDFFVKKLNKTGKSISQIDLKKIYNNELAGENYHTRIVNVDNAGSIYQLYADPNSGLQIIKYSPMN